jgi:4-aminobutyrate aminotransferase/diaminobutyrate-pyruvate transaminase/4-aminobutyrate aminotransferase/(S)-3-amino-2-methylpropionate transaminase
MSMHCSNPVLFNTFGQHPQPTERIETRYRRIVTPLPAPGSLDQLRRAARLFPAVNCYQPPIVWDRAEGFQVFDAHGNCWIDFSSTAVMANSGHGHPAIRDSLVRHAREGLLAQFNFASEIRIRLAERLLELAPPGVEKVYFWTTGSEAIESAVRLAREWGRRRDPWKYHLVSFTDDYHGCTLAAHQLSGDSAAKPWLPHPDAGIHRFAFPDGKGRAPGDGEPDWHDSIRQSIARCGIEPHHVAAVVVETLQGWGAVPFPPRYIQALRRWADEHDVLLVFDEIQTGFGRTGRWFAHQHYGVRADLICIGKGVTSTLPLAAVLGPAEVLDVLPPGEVTTTHAAHPLCCAAALANLDVLEGEKLVDAAARTGEIVRAELQKIRRRWPDHIAEVSGLGLLNAIHFCDPRTGRLDPVLARDVTFEAVRRGVMLFQVNRPTVKICPPLVIPPEAAVEGVGAVGEALDAVLGSR